MGELEKALRLKSRGSVSPLVAGMPAPGLPHKTSCLPFPVFGTRALLAEEQQLPGLGSDSRRGPLHAAQATTRTLQRAKRTLSRTAGAIAGDADVKG